MIYKINELAKLSGVSTRTLRYYNQIDLLVPEKNDSNGYRIYGQVQVDKLQQILFYRELGVSLADIKTILSSSDYDREKMLERHLSALLNKRERIDLLITNLKTTIRSLKGDIAMSDKEKFEGFKQKMLEENEKIYGDELRSKYDKETLEGSVQKVKGMSEEAWEKTQELSTQINALLKVAVSEGNPASETAQSVCDLHRQWLCMFWKEDTYSKEVHKALAEGYVADERFTAYYDKIAVGGTKFLRDAVAIYCG